MLANRRELGFGERAGLALEGDLFGVVPRAGGVEPADQALQLLRRQERRRAAAEVDEVEAAAGDRRLRRVELPFARQQIEILLDLARVLVGVDPEVAEMAALPAERDVQVQTKRARPASAGACSRAAWASLTAAGIPDRKRRIIRDEIAPDVRLLDGGFPCAGHCITSLYVEADIKGLHGLSRDKMAAASLRDLET